MTRRPDRPSARSARPGLALLLAAALIASAAPAAAYHPGPARPQAAPERLSPPVVNPNRISMDFHLVEGRGVFGHTRWIQASGPITADTPARFEAFARGQRLAGMTIALDSPGGSMNAGLALGRAIRAAGLDTTIGRTVTHREAGRASAVLLTHGIGCASACTYAFLGGVRRTVAATARFAVHQFSRSIGRDGRFVSEAPTAQDFEHAQRRMAELAVYVQEMGVDARLLVLASSVPYGPQTRTLTPPELSGLRIAMAAAVDEAERGDVGWSVNHRADAPMLFRRVVGARDAGARIDEEVTLACHRDPAQVAMMYRIVLARAADARPLALPALAVELGGATVPWRPAGAVPQARGTNGSIWVTVPLPRAGLEQAAARGTLAVALADPAGPESRTEFGAGLGAVLPGFLANCDAARAAVTAAR